MPALARLAQVEHRAARHHLAAMGDERLQHRLQVEQLRLAVNQRDHVHAEAVLQLRMLVQVVQHDLGNLAALQFDHDAHAGFVRLVADVRNAFEPLLGHQVGDALEQRLLVDLVGQLVDDDRLAVALAGLLEVRTRAHHHAPAPRAVALVHARDAVDDGRGRKIRRRHELDQVLDRAIRHARAGAGRHRRPPTGCAAECWSPCRPRCPRNR